jgi:N-acetylglucosamine-6-phosphate deacetylase
MKYYLKSKEVYLENKIMENLYILIEDEYIKDIKKEDEIKKDNEIKIIDCGEKIIAPALIDIHIHGAVGKDVMDGDYEALNTISKYLAKNGVGSFLPTTLTAPILKIKKALINIKKSIDRGVMGAEILGAYLEGPYLTEEHKGAHPIEYMRDLDLNEIKELIRVSDNNISVFALAPEKENSDMIITFLNDNGIKSTIAHTNANYQEINNAIEKGVSLSTHTFNGMSGLHHRKPGSVGAILASDKIYTELIADNIHVHPAVIKILYNLKKEDKTILISDCMRAGGLKDGDYSLGELKVNVKDSIARTKEGSLAGSTLKVKDAVINIKKAADIDLFTALKMASVTPAKLLGLDNEIGSIKKGKKANLTVIDQKMNIYLTIVNGKVVYNKL